MLTNNQIQEIDIFLQKKKLSNDLLEEIKDHFINQISELMESEGLSFPEAFLKTSFAWKNDLEMIRADILSPKYITRLEKKTLNIAFKNILKNSFKLSVVLGFISLFFEDAIFPIILIFGFGLIIQALYMLISKKIKFFDYITLSFHPLLIRYCIGLFGFLMIYRVVAYLFSNVDMMNFELLVFQLLGVFSSSMQMQLLYWKSKKKNVLV